MRRTNLRRADGFTLIELMVVVLIIAVLIAIAIPTFIGFRTGAQDAQAKTALRTAEETVLRVGLEEGQFPKNSDLLALLPTLEPSVVWLNHKVNSTGPGEISIDEDNGGTELNLAAKSESGACFYLRAVLDAPSARRVVTGASDCQAHDYQGGPDTGW